MRTYNYKRENLSKAEKKFLAALLDADIKAANEELKGYWEEPPEDEATRAFHQMAKDEIDEKEGISRYLKGKGDRAEWKEDFINGFLTAYVREKIKADREIIHTAIMTENSELGPNEKERLRSLAREKRKLTRLSLNQEIEGE